MDLKSRFFSGPDKESSRAPRKFVSWRERFSKRRRGSVLVETALCLTFFILPMFFAGLQYSIIVNASHTVNRMAREGARFAAVHGGESTFDNADTQSNPPSLRNYMKSLCVGTNISWSDISSPASRITVTPAASRYSGQGITVTVTYPMNKKMIFQSAALTRMGLGLFNRDHSATATFMLE